MGSGRIARIDAAGKAEDWLIDLLQPVGIIDQDDKLYVSQYGERTISSYAFKDKSLQTVIPLRYHPQYFTFTSAEFSGGSRNLLRLFGRAHRREADKAAIQ